MPSGHPGTRVIKYCACGCKQLLSGARYTHRLGHKRRGVNPGRGGYRVVWDPVNKRQAHEHVVVAEKALGRRLKKGECVHHVNMNKVDNRSCNLVICTRAYNNYLHLVMQQRYVREHFSHI